MAVVALLLSCAQGADQHGGPAQRPRFLIRQHKVRRVLELRGNFDWEGDLPEMRRSRFE